MKKIMMTLLGIAVVALYIGMTSHYAVAKKDKGKYSGCTTIPEGGIFSIDGQELKPGYDGWGYNYQAHTFNGPYCYYDRHYDPKNPDWNDDLCDTWLQMKWNDAWLSNKDCEGNGFLDRHYGSASYIGSGAWLTNHQQGTYTYIDDKGKEKECTWTYFVKIVAAPSDAVAVDGTWFASDGTEIGPAIWGAFAIIQSVYNDSCAGSHGIEYLSPAGPGFGKWKK